MKGVDERWQRGSPLFSWLSFTLLILDLLQKESVTHMGRCHVRENGVKFYKRLLPEAEIIPLSELNVSYSGRRNPLRSPKKKKKKMSQRTYRSVIHCRELDSFVQLMM